MLRRASVLAIIVAIVATLAGCGADDQSGGATSPPASAPGSTAGSAQAPAALRFTAPLVGGGTFDGAAMGERPVVFWFWAPT